MNGTITLYRNIVTSKRELKDLAYAWLAIAFIFTIATRGFSFGFLGGFLISLLTVGSAFIVHEMAHKITAQRFGFSAEFQKNTPALIGSVILSFLGMIFIAPGAVIISGLGISPSENGKISWAGPLSNLILGVVLMVLYYVSPAPFNGILLFGAFVNCLIGLFNMIPVWILDGNKIFQWDKKVYGGTLIALVVLYILTRIPSIF